MTAGKSTLALALVRLLQSLDRQLEDYRRKIRKCFREHPDHALFESLPGAGEKIAPRLLAELASAPDLAADPQWLQTHAGMAPVSYQSGQVSMVHLRRQCNRFLQHTVHLWADLSRHYCDWARIYYQAHRKKGKAMRVLCVVWECGGSKSSRR